MRYSRFSEKQPDVVLDQLYTLRKARYLLGEKNNPIPRTTIYYWIKTGQLPVVRLRGREIRLSGAVILQFWKAATWGVISGQYPLNRARYSETGLAIERYPDFGDTSELRACMV